MESCLLCLEHKLEFNETIDVNSNLWKELDVISILEKYLWPMSHIKTSSWMCTDCWKELNEFHKFYLRIEEAHKSFGIKNENVEENESSNDEEYKTVSDNKILNAQENCSEENLCGGLVETSGKDLKYTSNEYELSKDLLKNDFMLEELETLIENESLSNNSSFMQKRKRGRPRKGISTVDLNAKNKKDTAKPNTNRSIRVANKRKKAKEIPRHDHIIVKKNKTTDDDSKIEQNTQLINKPSESDSDSNNGNDQYSDHMENKTIRNKICPPKTDHNENDNFLKENFEITCFLCNIPFETFLNMRKHFDEHHTERGHVKCCNKKFYRRSILVDHVHFHLNPNYFKCSQCGKVMSDRRCLELHAEIHESTQQKNHCCDICGKGFAKLGVLKKHRMIHLCDEEKRFSCSECGKNFASNYLLSSHYRAVHLMKYAKICDICGKSIRCKYVFERHMLQHEGKSAPSVNCDVCGLVVTDKKALKRHKDVIHPEGGQHEYTCSICSKTSPNLRAHKRHVQYKHVMGYDHKCTICDKAFKRAQTLKEHMASHTGTVLYTCPWCPKTFNSNANMHKHRKRVHPIEWEEASRKRYSGNLPPNFKPPTVNEHTDLNMVIDV